MFFRDYPEVQSAEENDVVLLDRLSGGTKTIKIANMFKKFKKIAESGSVAKTHSEKIFELFNAYNRLTYAEEAASMLIWTDGLGGLNIPFRYSSQHGLYINFNFSTLGGSLDLLSHEIGFDYYMVNIGSSLNECEMIHAILGFTGSSNMPTRNVRFNGGDDCLGNYELWTYK